MKKTFTTYATQNKAFENGNGDVFFIKNNEFICVSRNDDFTELEENGFRKMSLHVEPLFFIPKN
jgi:hypothetical protein